MIERPGAVSPPLEAARPEPAELESAPLESAWRSERAAVVATLARRLGDLQLAEDATQEAFATAAARWPAQGVPRRPGAWLTTVAWRKALDVLRRERPRAAATDGDLVAEVPAPEFADLVADDDLLRLVLTCCHPALDISARVALTLRHVAGLPSRQIAAAFLVTEPTLAKRLVRARAKIRDAGISFELPERRDLPQRMSAVRTVVYLVFNAGYLAAGDGPAVRSDLCEEAVWLARQVYLLTPGDEESAGLLALLLLLHSRAAARFGETGRLVTFDDQDRSSWNTALIGEARAVLATTGTVPPGPYQLQAAIELLHISAPSPDDVDRALVADLYAGLARIDASPVVEVNRAVAVGRAQGPHAGLDLLSPILAGGALDHYPPLHAAHADLLQRAGDAPGARVAWRRSAEASSNPAQRDSLWRRAADMAVPAAQTPVGPEGAD